jgi:hypothetical protein
MLLYCTGCGQSPSRPPEVRSESSHSEDQSFAPRLALVQAIEQAVGRASHESNRLCHPWVSREDRSLVNIGGG